MEELRVQMLGCFSIETQGRRINDSENRSQKPWLLLAYLLFHRDRVVTQEELLRLCWRDEDISGDPANALRVVLHRSRAMLDRLGCVPGLELIVRSQGGFQWSDRLPVAIDVEEFRALYESGKAARDMQQRRDCFERALGLYCGDFLGRNAGDNWAGHVAGRLRGMYMEMAAEVLELCRTAGESACAVELCRRMLAVEPWNEEIHRRLMAALSEMGREEEAVRHYEQLRADLLAEFDRLPGRETAAVYFHALKKRNPSQFPIVLRRQDLDEKTPDRGAKVCDFAFYRMFYSSAEWLVLQCGLSIYHVLFKLENRPGRTVSERTRERLMDALVEQLRLGLHRGDAISRCAGDQIVGMVQAKDYESACQICERQTQLFYREHPNAPMELHYGTWRVGGEK